MNDDELELRLRETQLRTELQRRVVPPDAPDSLYRHVAGLGLSEPVGRNERPASAAMSHGQRFRRGAGVLGGLATAASIAVLLAVGLSWRSSHGTGEVGGGSSSPSASATAYVSPTPRPTPSRFPAWSGAPAYVQASGRLDSQFGWVIGIPEPYPGGNAIKLYLTYDGGATWVDRTPKDGGDFSNLHFADRMNAWFMQEVLVGSAPVTGDVLATHWIFRTSDGGVTWSKHSLPAPTIYSMGSFEMPDGQHGLVTLTSLDQSEPSYGNSSNSTPLTGRRAGMAMTGPARTMLGQVWRTDDGGTTWTKVMDVRGDPNFPFWPTPATADEAWAPGYTASEAPLILHSTDGGRSWKSSVLPLPKGYVTSGWVQPVPSGLGNNLTLTGLVNNSAKDVDVPMWAYVSWASTDGGVTWTLTSTTPLGLAGMVASSRFSDRFVLVSSATSAPAILRYVDIDSPGSPGVLDASSVCHGSVAWATMVSPQDAWALCSVRGATPQDWHSYLYGTTDGGKTWKKMMGAP